MPRFSNGLRRGKKGEKKNTDRQAHHILLSLLSIASFSETKEKKKERKHVKSILYTNPIHY